VWTDPQIHTIDGQGFGMNPHLRVFPLSPPELLMRFIDYHTLGCTL
jgi:hypothetical protein